MGLTRGTLLKRASVAALALALGKLPEPSAVREAVLTPTTDWQMTRALPAWLPMDGRTITASEYPQLHAALGDVYGKPSRLGRLFRREFQVPDLRGSALTAKPMRDSPEGTPDVLTFLPMMRTDGAFAGQIEMRREDAA